MYKNMEFLTPLANSMTQKEPTARPSAAEALRQFEDISGKLSIHVVKWKVKKVKSHRVIQLYRNLTSLGPVCIAYVNWLSSKLSTYFFIEGTLLNHLRTRTVVEGTIVCPTSYLVSLRKRWHA